MAGNDKKAGSGNAKEGDSDSSSVETFRQIHKHISKKRQFEQRPFKRKSDKEQLSELDKLEWELIAVMEK